jgi:beta-galactosidase
VPFQSHERQAFNGMALIIVKAKKGQKKITVEAESEGLTLGTIVVKAE